MHDLLEKAKLLVQAMILSFMMMIINDLWYWREFLLIKIKKYHLNGKSNKNTFASKNKLIQNVGFFSVSDKTHFIKIVRVTINTIILRKKDRFYYVK